MKFLLSLGTRKNGASDDGRIRLFMVESVLITLTKMMKIETREYKV